MEKNYYTVGHDFLKFGQESDETLYFLVLTDITTYLFI